MRTFLAPVLLCLLAQPLLAQSPLATLGRPIPLAAPARQPVATLGRPVATLGRPIALAAPTIQQVSFSTLSAASPAPPSAPVVRANDSLDYCEPGPSTWFTSDLLLWWVKPGPLSVPVVTQGNPTNAVPGAIGQPGTQVLSSSTIDYGPQLGVRGMFGGWFDANHTFGMEGGGFYLGQGSHKSSFTSDPSGNPALYVPLFRPDTNSEGSVTLSDPLAGFSGGLEQVSTSRLWGLEVNGIWGLSRWLGCNFELLGGFRYLDLGESLTLNGTSQDLVIDDLLTWSDKFTTRNQFYGGQVGIRGKYILDCFDISGEAKLALGGTHQVVSISGTSTRTGVINPGTSDQGVFAVASNSGRRTGSQFGIVPQFGLQLGWNCSRCTRLFVAYDALFWSNVVRPGNQIDRNVNLNPASTPAAPQPLFKTSDFWAQGLSLGLLFRF